MFLITPKAISCSYSTGFMTHFRSPISFDPWASTSPAQHSNTQSTSTDRSQDRKDNHRVRTTHTEDTQEADQDPAASSNTYYSSLIAASKAQASPTPIQHGWSALMCSRISLGVRTGRPRSAAWWSLMRSSNSLAFRNTASATARFSFQGVLTVPPGPCHSIPAGTSGR